ncbi:MAG: hypothetical protein ACM3PY_00975 [Omnitrophica WOR_2 bacterium]
MKRFRWAAFLYHWLLSLYPPGFRAEFGSEMEQVFLQEAEDASRIGGTRLVRLLLRELLALPAVSWRLHKGNREYIYMETNDVTPVRSFNASPHPLAPLTRSETILGMLPFILVGIGSILTKVPYNSSQGEWLFRMASILILATYPVILLVLLAGWLSGFPRWVYPYLVYSIVSSFSLMNSSTPGLTLFGISMWGGALWGWRAWVPLGVISILALLFSRPPWKPLAQLIKNVWNDWSLLVFGLYGMLPLAVSVFLDEMEPGYSFPTAIIAVLFILAGALLYLKISARRIAILGLLTFAFLALLSLGVGSELYWQTHNVNFVLRQRRLIEGPVPWTAILSKSFLVAIIMTLILLVPGLVGITNWLVNRRAGKRAL